MSEPPAKQARTDEGDAMEASARQATTSSGQSLQSRETPISIPPTITYGLQDTHTAIFPITFYLSATRIDDFGTATLRLCLNDLDQQQIVLDTFQKGGALNGVNPTTAPTSNNAIYNYARLSNQTHNTVTAATYTRYPSTLTSEKVYPYWWDYYSTLYTYYTVLGCEYEVTCLNVADNINNIQSSLQKDILIAKHVESIGGSTQNREFPKNIKIQELFAQKQLQWINVDQCIHSTKNKPTVISGYHKTGTTKRDVANDGDVKTWSVIGGTAGAPTNTYKEYLQLDIGRNPMTANTESALSHMNMQIRLKYTVQLKQLRTQGMYMTGENDLIQTLPDDALPGTQITFN